MNAKARIWAFQVTAVLLVLSASAQERGATTPSDGFRYEVNRLVSEFRDVDDFTTPEAAYATVHHHLAKGRQDWKAMSIQSLADRLPPDKPGIQSVASREAEWLLGARILEVHKTKDFAVVVAQDVKGSYDIRIFGREKGQWLNGGQDGRPDLEGARHKALQLLSYHVPKPVRPKVDDPAAYLAPFVDYLKDHGRPPKEFILESVASHRLTIIGEIHHRPSYWALNSDVVRDPAFARSAGTIYMELPGNGQSLVNRFLVADKYDPAPVVEMLRDMLEMGWPDQPMLEFFQTVWTINQQLASDKQLRIVLVDMARPWKEIRVRSDWRSYETDRDQLMADNILKDLAIHADKNPHALFLVGYGHVAEGLTLALDNTQPAAKTTGWRLRQRLGDEVFSFIQHGPVMTNVGSVSGRRCLGLFDSAFLGNRNEPVAFGLAGSPFGVQRFDPDPELAAPCSNNYQDAFDAYIYLGPLEDESFSSLIPGFYTDEFAHELDRRYRLMYGKGLIDGLRLPAADGASVAAWMSNSWGKPRDWRTRLGPIDAWQEGDDWEQARRELRHRLALKNPEAIKTAAVGLFDALRTADYSSPQSIWSIDYRAHHHVDLWVKWVCQHFASNPIESVELGDVTANKEGIPSIQYRLLLRDGSYIKGLLPFEYQPLSDSWLATAGLDWHLQANPIQHATRSR